MKRVCMLFFSLILAVSIVSCKKSGGSSFLPFGSSSGANNITAFSINGVNATIVGTSITLTLPCTVTDLTDLVATFATDGNLVQILGADQDSGVTPNDFSDEVVYSVTAENGSVKEYMVTVTVAPDNVADILTYSIDGVSGVISGTDITVTLPCATTDVTALVATFTINGESVSVGGTDQESGTTPNNFTTPKTYRVLACDATPKDYTVTVVVPPAGANDITAFSIAGQVSSNITGTDISVTMPYGTDVTTLVATFTTTGVSVKIGSVTQESGVTVNNFTSPKTYRVRSCDDTPKDYTVTVTVAPAEWKHQAYLKAPNNSNGDYFGQSVSISEDTIAVGAPNESSNTTAIINGSDLSGTNNSGLRNGAVYVFTRSGTTWSHQAYLKAPNGANDDYFGYSVSISGDTIAVGSINEKSTTTAIINGGDLSSTDNSGTSNGAVYVFTRNGVTWSLQSYLKAPNNSNGDAFGDAVSISGDTIAVGTSREDSTTTAIINGSDLSSTNNSGGANGAVYVFTRSGTSWSHQAYLKAPNTSTGDSFGQSVSISGDTIAVAAYEEDSTTTSIINGSDLSSTNNSGDQNGAVYVFTRSGSTWSHQAYLKAPNNSNSDAFGGSGANLASSVSISGDTIAVGAYGEDSTTSAIINGSDLSSTNDSGDRNGAVYVFTRSGTTWSFQSYLKAPNNSSLYHFGDSVSVYGDTIAVGASYEYSSTTAIINGSDLSSTNNSGSDNGAVYVFTRSGTNWSHEAYLKAPNNSESFRFGNSVSVSGSTVAVGAYGETSTTSSIINGSNLSSTNNSGSGNGAVYVFTK